MSFTKTIGGLISDAVAVIVRVDSMTDTLQTIDYAHHEAHEGEHFTCCVVDDAMGSGDTIVLAWKMPAGAKKGHLIIDWRSLGKSHIELCEGATWNASSGAQQDVFNNNRDLATASIVLENTTGAFVANDALILNPTNFAAVAVIWASYAFADRKVGGSSTRGDTEWILNDDTQYAVRLTADEISNAGEICLAWYEHTDNN